MPQLASRDYYFSVTVSFKIEIADQAVFLYCNTVNTKRIHRSNFLYQIESLAWNPNTILLPWGINYKCAKTWIMSIDRMSYQKNQWNKNLKHWVIFIFRYISYFYFTSLDSFVKCWCSKFRGMNSVNTYLVPKQETQCTSLKNKTLVLKRGYYVREIRKLASSWNNYLRRLARAT